MRELINEALDYLVNNYPRVRVVLIEAPTGYGKTYNSHIPFLEFNKKGLARGFIYVAPTRSLVRQQARDFLSKLQGYSISYQSMDINLEVQVPNAGPVQLKKNPKLSSNVNITTIDSFMFNLMRMPVESLNKPAKWRYMTYRSYIFTSYVFLDEVHLMVEDSSITLASLLLGLYELILSATPTVVATATLGDNRIKCLALGECGSIKLGTYSSVKDSVRVFRLGNKESKDSIFITVRDKDWESKTTEQIFQFKELNNYKEIISVIKEYGDRILILTNTVKRAVDIYELVSEELGDIALFHSKLDEYDRDANAKIIDSAKVIVGTDAIGVGINPKNVKILIMDIPPNVDTFIQRIGRICRNIDNDRDCTVYLLKDNENLPKYYLDNKDKLGSINWRLPYRCCGKEGYSALINNYMPEPKLDVTAYQDLLSSLSFVIIEQEDLKKKYRRYCNLVRDSVIIRGITKRTIHSFTHSHCLWRMQKRSLKNMVRKLI